VIIAVLAFFPIAFVMAHLAYQLKTGKLYDRRWRAFTNRHENSMLYWSSITLEMLVALMLVSIWGYAIAGLKK
jgi:hypothetical protein